MGKWKQTGEARGRNAKPRHGCGPTAGSTWRGSAWSGEALGCGWNSLQLGGSQQFVGHSCRSGCCELRLSPVIWTGTQHRSVAMVVWQLAFQTEKQSHKAWPPLNLLELASLCPWCGVVEHIVCKPRNWHYSITFSLHKGWTLTGPRKGV